MTDLKELKELIKEAIIKETNNAARKKYGILKEAEYDPEKMGAEMASTSAELPARKHLPSSIEQDKAGAVLSLKKSIIKVVKSLDDPDILKEIYEDLVVKLLPRRTSAPREKDTKPDAPTPTEKTKVSR